jgi:hypothetical protein
MPQFHFGEEVLIDRSLDQVRGFFADVQSLVLWDRSVSKVICTSPTPLTSGAKFTTIGPSRRSREGKRSEYQVVDINGDEAKIALVNSPLFKSAIWIMRLVERGSGTKVACEMNLSTDLLHAPIGLLLKLNAKAIATDLQFLKRAIENGEVAKR